MRRHRRHKPRGSRPCTGSLRRSGRASSRLGRAADAGCNSGISVVTPFAAGRDGSAAAACRRRRRRAEGRRRGAPGRMLPSDACQSRTPRLPPLLPRRLHPASQAWPTLSEARRGGAGRARHPAPRAISKPRRSSRGFRRCRNSARRRRAIDQLRAAQGHEFWAEPRRAAGGPGRAVLLHTPPADRRGRPDRAQAGHLGPARSSAQGVICRLPVTYFVNGYDTCIVIHLVHIR